jgi:hypothetical protein
MAVVVGWALVRADAFSRGEIEHGGGVLGM